MGPQYGTCFLQLSWCQHVLGGIQIFLKKICEPLGLSVMLEEAYSVLQQSWISFGQLVRKQPYNYVCLMAKRDLNALDNRHNMRSVAIRYFHMQKKIV